MDDNGSHDATPASDKPLLQYLLTRRSAPADLLGEPGPDAAALRTLLTIGARVPDHKKLAPWRYILFLGEARAKAGEVFAAALLARDPDAAPERVERELKKFLRAPLVVGVVSRCSLNPAAPEWEQVLSAGAVCLNLIHGAEALGFGAHWVTEWIAYDEQVGKALGVRTGERIAGFIHVGSPRQRLGDRERPDIDAITTYWAAPVG
jgi:nitroreductase